MITVTYHCIMIQINQHYIWISRFKDIIPTHFCDGAWRMERINGIFFEILHLPLVSVVKMHLTTFRVFSWPNLPKVHPLDTHHPSTLIYWNNSVTWYQSNRNNTTRFRFYYKCIKIILSSYLLLCCVSVKTPLKFVCTVLHIMNHIKKSVKI